MNTELLAAGPFPPMLLGIYAVAAVVSFLLRTWARYVALTGAALATLIGIGLWQLDFSRPLWIMPGGLAIDFAAPSTRFGYTLQIQQSNLPILVISLLIGATALALTARKGQDPNFPALTWILLAAYTVIGLMTSGPRTPVLLAPIFLTMITALAIFALQGGQAVSPSGPVRTLIPPVLATPLFLVAAWYVDQIPLNPQDTVLTQTAGALLAVGLLLLLMPFPLHSAWPAASATAQPPATLLVTLLYQLMLIYISFQVLSSFPFLFRDTDWSTWLSWLGLITAVWGGFATLGAERIGRLWGYAGLHDWGLIILALAAPGIRSWTLVLFLFILRAISMFTSAAGMTTIIQHVGGTEIERLRGVGSRLPWNSAAFLLGGLGLVGFPLSAGFAGHWAALQTIAAVDWRPAGIVLIASGVAVVSFVRVARLMFGQLENRSVAREGPLSVTMAVIALVVTVVAALAPQIIDGVISRALAAFG